MTDLDVDLKRLFDERLEGVKPPPLTSRRQRRRLRLAAASATAALAVAAANGADCATFPAKVQVWAQSHRSDLAGTDHTAAKAELAKMVAETFAPNRRSATHVKGIWNR